MAVGKKLRFEILKRDGFTCRYCGRRPPEVILNVDHVLAVSKGGGDEPINLIASCWECNSGKSDADISSEVIPPQPPRKSDSDLQKLREAHDKITEQRGRNWQWTSDFIETWKQLSGENPYEPDIDSQMRDSLKCFLKKMTPAEITEALQITFESSKVKDSNRFRYFCGVCWRMIKKDLAPYESNVRQIVQQNS